jgi:hypothetical protein
MPRYRCCVRWNCAHYSRKRCKSDDQQWKGCVMRETHGSQLERSLRADQLSQRKERFPHGGASSGLIVYIYIS